MSIVAFSQTLGSLGDEIGRELARVLSWEFADREIIARAAQRFGEGVMELEHVTEEKPTLWERFTDTKRHYLTYVEAIIFEMAARDNVILSGGAVCPGPLDTSCFYPAETPDSIAYHTQASVQGRLGAIENIVPLVELLVLPRGGWITGQTLFVNGGYVAR